MKNLKTLFVPIMACSFLVGCGSKQPDVPPTPPVPVVEDGGIDLTYMRMNAPDGAKVKFNYTFTSETDDLQVYWGDGTVDNSNSHTYKKNGRYHIYVTGHIDNIALVDNSGKKYAADNNYITNILLSNHITTISSKAFDTGKVSTLQSVFIPKTVGTIGSGAFNKKSTKIYYCEKGANWDLNWHGSVETDNIQSGVNLCMQDDNILYAVYSGSSNNFASIYICCDLKLKNAEIKSEIIFNNQTYSLTEIWDSAFYDMPTLESVKIPSSVKSIGKYAFVNCTNLKTLELNEGLESIGINAFENVGITSVTFPKSLKILEDKSFNNCSHLERVIFQDGSNLKKIDTDIFNGSKNIREFKLAEGLEEINDRMIMDAAITELALPSTLTQINDFPIRNCALLTAIDATKFTSVDKIPNIEMAGFLNPANINNTIVIRMAKGLSKEDFISKKWPDEQDATDTITGIIYEPQVG